ncbi:protein-disulfide isomerase [Sagittula marina]|uniref:Protein-disulfide isomerase n=1 Tax=Sagittula marina TaxID=943940 RepID=A0A7W6GTJ4_9RHOB|nr:DsbA family protein [Sagittula marina]MBB3986882.1 protein-disulfide isomerase [Sagittula marina]
MNKLLTSGAVALALIAGGAFYMTQGATTNANGTITVPGAAVAQTQEGGETEIDTSSVVEMTMGAEDAPIEVIEYASYTCPHCASANETLIPQLKKNYVDTGKVKFTYREVYFDKYGMWASLIARCGGPEKFFGISDMIYKAQDDFIAPAREGDEAGVADELRKIGRMAGLDNDQLEACLTDSTQLRTLLTWFQENATADDINSTPSFIIDGEKYSNMSYADFSEILDEKLGE